MCGISGVVGLNAHARVGAVQKMMDAMRHRGPDGHGLFVSASRTCVLGHRRLSILDLSDNAAQPMTDSTGKCALCYNGECYNYETLRTALSNEGEHVVSSGDTEVVLRTLCRHGPKSLCTLNAMFALAFWDESQQTLLLARDRFGQKPLYYTVQDDLLVFASEVRALLASGLVPRVADLESVRAYFACGSVPGPRTIVAEVDLLPAGHFLLASPERLSHRNPQQYWLPPRDKMDVSSETLANGFSSAVQRHMISDVPIGVFLSGGIDSSAIAASAMKELRGNVTTLCVVYPDQIEQSEGLHARRVAEAIGSDHIEVPVTGGKMLELGTRALDSMDQPTVDGVNTYVVSSAAREAGLKVALTGLASDELFGGYLCFFPDPVWLLSLRRRLGSVGRVVVNRLLGLAGNHRKVAKLVDALSAPDGLLCAYLVRRRLFSSEQVARLYPNGEVCPWYKGIPDERFSYLEELIRGRDPFDAIGLLEMSQYMEQQLLRDSDVMGMAHGLEIRVPFLDADFASMALRLPSSARAPGARQKHCLAKAIEGWLPKANISRPKQGFSLPFSSWMQNELRNEVCSGIDDLATALPNLSHDSIQRVITRFFRQPERVGWTRPWALYVLGRYLKMVGLTAQKN